MQRPNARFWAWTGMQAGPVKITLRPNQTLTWGYCVPTGEGWAREGRTWTFDGTTVQEDLADEGTDCDGFLGRYSSWECSLSDLATGQPVPDVPGAAYPVWTPLTASQHDQFAEAAGY